MPRIRLLDRIDRQGPHCVYTNLVDIQNNLSRCHHTARFLKQLLDFLRRDPKSVPGMRVSRSQFIPMLLPRSFEFLFQVFNFCDNIASQAVMASPAPAFQPASRTPPNPRYS